MQNVESFNSTDQTKARPMTPKARGNSFVVIATDLCKGCGFCIDACPPKVLAETDGLNIMGYHAVYFTGEGCTGCGICFYACPEPGAITVYKNAHRS